MAQFVAFAPGVEVNGQTVLSIVAGMGAFRKPALAILERNGIVDPQPGAWYPQQDWLNAFREIAERLGPATLFQIGAKIPENADFPPEIDSVEKALGSIDVAYHMNHRNGEIGHYHFRHTGATSGVLNCPNPYPCDFDRGIVSAMSRKFAPAGRPVKVAHDDTAGCRKTGAESCTYSVTW